MTRTLTRADAEGTGSGAPAELLIPEARRRQRSRYRRRVVAVIAAAVLLALLVAGLGVAGTRGPSASPAPGAPRAPAAGAAAKVLVRPVLCFTKAASGGATSPGSLPASCPAPYAATATAVQPSSDGDSGYKIHLVPDDPAFDGVPTSTHDVAARVVLLPFADPRRGRLLLGPSVLRLSGATVSAVHVVPGPTDAWTVRIELSASASVQLDRVAYHYFHTYLAVDFGGKVVGDPLVEPAQTAFSSLQGRFDLVGQMIGGGLSGPLAKQFAADLRR